MLSNLRDLLKPALEGGYAVPCFNVFGYEDALAIINAAQQRDASVILAVNLDMVNFMPMQSLTGMLLPLAHEATVPVCLHLDHNYDLDSVRLAIDLGFSSVMYDGSQRPIKENIEGIQQIIAHAANYQTSVEAEVGSVPYLSGRDHIKSALTEADEAIAMQDYGRPDALAISVGNVHRIERGYVDIDYDRFHLLEERLDLPLVIHGTSGIRPDDITYLAQRSVCKFNIGTCLRKRFGSALRKALAEDKNLFDRLTLMKEIIPEISDEASQMLEILGQ